MIKKICNKLAKYMIYSICICFLAINADANDNVPRFASTKSDKINVRQGPGNDHKIKYIYKTTGFPVEIIAEFDNWRRIRDADGDEGWVWHSLLSGRRTAIVAPWVNADDRYNVYQSNSEDSQILAIVENKVIVSLLSCDTTWCKISVNNKSGFIKQNLLWGVYPNERFLEN